MCWQASWRAAPLLQKTQLHIECLRAAAACAALAAAGGSPQPKRSRLQCEAGPGVALPAAPASSSLLCFAAVPACHAGPWPAVSVSLEAAAAPPRPPAPHCPVPTACPATCSQPVYCCRADPQACAAWRRPEAAGAQPRAEAEGAGGGLLRHATAPLPADPSLVQPRRAGGAATVHAGLMGSWVVRHRMITQLIDWKQKHSLSPLLPASPPPTPPPPSLQIQAWMSSPAVAAVVAEGKRRLQSMAQQPGPPAAAAPPARPPAVTAASPPQPLQQQQQQPQQPPRQHQRQQPQHQRQQPAEAAPAASASPGGGAGPGDTAAGVTDSAGGGGEEAAQPGHTRSALKPKSKPAEVDVVCNGLRGTFLVDKQMMVRAPPPAARYAGRASSLPCRCCTLLLMRRLHAPLACPPPPLARCATVHSAPTALSARACAASSFPPPSLSGTRVRLLPSAARVCLPLHCGPHSAKPATACSLPSVPARKSSRCRPRHVLNRLCPSACCLPILHPPMRHC
jgi:hypothetical protein